MLIYTVPFGLFLCLTSVSRIFYRRDMRLLVALTVLFCILLAGFRSETDNDWATYLGIFQSIPSATNGPDSVTAAIEDLYLEPVFTVLVSLIKVVLPDVGVFLVISLMALTIYFVCFVRVARYPAISFLMYVGDGFYLREFTQLRFGLAVSIGLASLVALYLGRTWRHRGLALVAMSLHYTGIVLLASRAWVRYVHTWRRVSVIATVLLLLSICGVFDGLVNALADAGLAPLRLLSYIDSEQDSAAVSQAVLLAQYALLMFSLRVCNDRDPQFFWVSIYALSFTLACLFSGFDLMRRLSFFFSPALYVLASVAMAQRRHLIVCVFVAYAAVLLTARFNILQPYATWL